MDIGHMNVPTSYPRWVACLAWVIDGVVGGVTRVTRFVYGLRRRS